jgi:hypothetical protein
MCVRFICVLLFDCCHVSLESLIGRFTVITFGSGMIHLSCPWICISTVARDSVATSFIFCCLYISNYICTVTNTMHAFITLFCHSAVHVSGSHTAHHQEAMCTMWQMVIIPLNVDCLWARMVRFATSWPTDSALCWLLYTQNVATSNEFLNAAFLH